MPSGNNLVRFALVGVGSGWEGRYREPIERLSHRMQITDVYDSVLVRSRQIATCFQAAPRCGLTAIVDDPDIDAIICRAPGWAGEFLLDALCRSEKAVFFADHSGSDSARLRLWNRIAEEGGRVRMPELSRRFTPSSNRLQEVMATELGSPSHIEITLPGDSSQTPSLIGLLDWCGYLFRTTAETVRVEQADAGERVHLTYSETPSYPAPRTASVFFEKNPDAKTGVLVRCESGVGEILSDDGIRWTYQDGETTTETLTGERSSLEVMLDLFCRRTVGGLISIPNLGDLASLLELVQAIEVSRGTGQVVPVGEARGL